MTDHCDTARLAELVREKLALVEQLAQLVRRQRDVVATDDLPALLRLLAGKQAVLEQLQAVDRRLDPFRAQDPDSRAWPTAAERARCRDDAERSQQLLAAIVEWERQCGGDLLRRRAETSARLEAVNTAAVAREAYVEASPASGVSLDLSAE